MADLRSRALAYLRSGAVTIGAARRPAPAERPEFVSARVVGHHAAYLVRLQRGAWTCSCQSVFSDGQTCAHVAAVQLVTGHATAEVLPMKAAS